MPITTELVAADPEKLKITPVITVNSGMLTIGATTLKLDGADIQVAETTYTTTSRTEPTSVEIILAKKKSDNSINYLVDEVVQNGSDTGYDFTGSPYVPVHYLASFKIPANTTDLNGCTIRVLKTVPSEPKFPVLA